MQLPPPAITLSWPPANYVDPPTRGHGVLVVSIVCTCLSFVVTCLRIYTRLRVTATAGLDDIFIVIGLIFAIGMAVATSMATEYWGFNRHVWDIPVTWLPRMEQLILAFQLTFSWSSGFTKISLLWFCRRLLGAGKRNFVVYNWAFIGTMIFVGFSVLLFTLLSILLCS